MDTNMSKFPQGKFRIPICQGYEYVNLPPGEFSGDISEFFILINRVLFIICSITTKYIHITIKKMVIVMQDYIRKL
jgi:hypothetical protein